LYLFLLFFSSNGLKIKGEYDEVLPRKTGPKNCVNKDKTTCKFESARTKKIKQRKKGQ
jgi:hypothetical protein